MADLQSVAARPVVSAIELAGWLGVSRRAVNGYDRAGLLGSSWIIGRGLVFTGPAVARFLDTRRQHQRPTPPNAATKDARGRFLSNKAAA